MSNIVKMKAQQKIIKYSIHNKTVGKGHSPATTKNSRWVLHKYVKTEKIESEYILMLIQRKNKRLHKNENYSVF